MDQKELPIHSFEETQPGIAIVHFTSPEQLQILKNLTSQPHRHDFYSCFFVQKGSLSFRADFTERTISAGNLLVSYPGQVLQFPSNPSEEFAGWVLAIKTAIISQEARLIINYWSNKIALLTLDQAKQHWYKTMFELINVSADDNQGTAGFDAELIRSLVHAFMVKTSTILQSVESKKNHECSWRSVELTRTFRLLVKEHFLTHKRPADYAGLLNITVSYLTDTIKSVTGFSATYFIQQEIVIEAQRLLFYSDQSIMEIAYQLGYEDYKYFTRLFGKLTGTSPSVFRNTNKNVNLPGRRSSASIANSGEAENRIQKE